MSQKEIHNYDIRIATNGDWYHEGSKINRIELVKLFASVLHKKDDNKYWLITPKEEGTIEVDDAPFVIQNLLIQVVKIQQNVGLHKFRRRDIIK